MADDPASDVPADTAGRPNVLRRTVRRLAAAARVHPLALGGVTFLASVVVIIGLLGLPSKVREENIAITWNDAIARLQIEPIYPPQEDIYVGDILLTLQQSKAAAENSTGKVSKVFAGRGIRIANIPMRDSITRAPYALDLAETAEVTGAGAQPQHPAADGAVATEIALSGVAFPGFSVKHHVHGRTGWLQFGFDRKSAEIEEIAISAIRTYSVPAPEAIRRLLLYCRSKDTGLNCTDDFARALLAYSLGEDVNRKLNGQYVYEINISLIRQVFLAGNIKSMRYKGESLSATAAPAAAAGGPATEATVPAVAGTTLTEGSSSRTVLEQAFNPPIAFGYRSISVAIPLPAADKGGGP